MVLAAYLSLALLSISTPVNEPGSHTLPDSKIRVHADDTLREVLADWTSLENISLAFDQSVAPERFESRCGLLADIDLQNYQISTFFETLLASHGIALTEVPTDGDRLLIAHDYFSAIDSVPIERTDEIREFKAHPALRMRTAASFQGHDERQLPTLLRILTRMMKPASGSTRETLQLQSPGVFAYDVVNVLRATDPNTADMASFRRIERIFQTPVDSIQFGNFKTLLDMVRVYDEATSFTIVITEETRRDLRQRSFDMKTSIALAEDVHSIVSKVLFAAGFTTSIPCDESSVLAIYNDTESQYARRLPVQYDSREDFDNLPSLSVFVPVKLEKSDGRLLPAKLRPHVKDVRTTVLMSLDSQSLLLGGAAGYLAELWSVIASGDK
ncbi:MAG: hypothetical protein ACI8TQ_002383 [Planctomycetota bacterium]|jgi:hypothetical protein